MKNLFKMLGIANILKPDFTILYAGPLEGPSLSWVNNFSILNDLLQEFDGLSMDTLKKIRKIEHAIQNKKFQDARNGITSLNSEKLTNGKVVNLCYESKCLQDLLSKLNSY